MPLQLMTRPSEGTERAPRRPGARDAPSPARADRRAAHETPPTPGTDGLAQLLRHAVVARAGTRLLQRYELVTETAAGVAGASEYRVLGAGAVEFEAQTVDTANRTISAPAAGAANPTVRVSDDGHMAVEHTNLGVRQPKVFYASAAVVTASNRKLRRAGGDFELYNDRVGALEVRTANGPLRTLNRVLPRTRAVPAGGRLAAHQGMTLNVSKDCIDMAQAVMKHAQVARMPHLAIGTSRRGTWNEFRAAKALVAWANTPNAGFMSVFKDPRKTAVKNAFNADPAATLQAIATSYANLLTNQPLVAAQAAQALGVNIHAAPEVGEAYETYRISTVATPQTHQDPVSNDLVRDFWGQHIGAVVARSGGDTVTLENYARSHEIGAMADAAPHYYFQMYGPANKPAQTWHASWAITAHGAPAIPVGDPAAQGMDAMTVVIKR